MSELERIADELRRGQEKDPWHGPSARQVLEGVTAAMAAAKPIPGAHSIWELVLHLAAWRGEVARRVRGGEPASPVEGDWPPVTDTSDAAWGRALRRLDDSYRQLAAAVGEMPETRLDQPIGKATAPAQDVVSYYVMLHGVAQHDAYHLGQVSLLARALGRE